MLSNIKAKIKRAITFQSKPSYKTMYENEKRMREELEGIHKTFCRQMDAVLAASKQSYSLHKIESQNKEF
jgi:hypothetical protein